MNVCRIGLFVFFLFLLTPVAFSQIITVGIEPAKLTVYGNQDVTFKLFNDKGDTDAIYTFDFSECEEHIKFGDSCYDGSPVTVKKGTTRFDPVKIKVCFRPKKTVECRFYVEGKPVGYEQKGMVSIRPRIAVPVKIFFDETRTKSPMSAIIKNKEGKKETKSEGIIEKIKKIFIPTTSTTTTLKLPLKRVNPVKRTTTTIQKGKVSKSLLPVMLLMGSISAGLVIYVLGRYQMWW